MGFLYCSTIWIFDFRGKADLQTFGGLFGRCYWTIYCGYLLTNYTCDRQQLLPHVNNLPGIISWLFSGKIMWNKLLSATSTTCLFNINKFSFAPHIPFCGVRVIVGLHHFFECLKQKIPLESYFFQSKLLKYTIFVFELLLVYITSIRILFHQE